MTPFSAVLASEWTKLASRRATYVMAGLAIGLAVVMTAAVAIVIGATWDDWKPADRATFDPAASALFGGIFSAIVLLVLGVTAVTAEYASGMMRLTLTATPRRGRVVAAKALVVAAIVAVVDAVALVAMLACGQAIFAAYGLETASFADWETLRHVAAGVALAPVLPLIGLALGFLLRSAAGAITTVLGLLFLPAIFGSLLPAWWEDHVLAYLPGQAAEAITSSWVEDAPDYLVAPGVGVLVVAAWLAAFLAAAAVGFMRRDA